MLKTLAIANYRSLLDVVVPLQRLNVVSGRNGSGKSSLYRALRLLASTAQDGPVTPLAREGGLSSTLWAGPEVTRWQRGRARPEEGRTLRRGPVRLQLGFADEELGYAIDLGLPPPHQPAMSSEPTMFPLDPEIKRECVWWGDTLEPRKLLADRDHAHVRVRDSRGHWTEVTSSLPPWRPLLSEVADPRVAPELLLFRERIRGWRFYDALRADPGAPARHPQVGSRTPVLGPDGSDLAAAWRTIVEAGAESALEEAVDDAFPGSRVEVTCQDQVFRLAMHQPGMLRPLAASELSEGTLRFLLWTAALHSQFPPELMVLNEPETSLHEDVLPALGRAIAAASSRTQLWVVTHSPALIEAMKERAELNRIHLEKVDGETVVEGQGFAERPHWIWPKR